MNTAKLSGVSVGSVTFLWHTVLLPRVQDYKSSSGTMNMFSEAHINLVICFIGPWTSEIFGGARQSEWALKQFSYHYFRAMNRFYIYNIYIHTSVHPFILDAGVLESLQSSEKKRIFV